MKSNTNPRPSGNPFRRADEDPNDRFLNRTSSASFSIRNGLQSRLAEHCAVRGISLSSFVSDAIVEKLERE